MFCQSIYLFILRAFDVELLYIAQDLGIPISEVAVNWQEIEGNFCLFVCLFVVF